MTVRTHDPSVSPRIAAASPDGSSRTGSDTTGAAFRRVRSETSSPTDAVCPVGTRATRTPCPVRFVLGETAWSGRTLSTQA